MGLGRSRSGPLAASRAKSRAWPISQIGHATAGHHTLQRLGVEGVDLLGSATMTSSRHQDVADGRPDLHVLRTMPVKPAINRAARAPVSSCSTQVL